MGILQSIREYLATDVEVELPLSSRSQYAPLEEKSGRSAITTIRDGQRFRVIFHGGVFRSAGSRVVLALDGGTLMIRRDFGGSVTMKISVGLGNVVSVVTKRFKINIGTKIDFRDPYGEPVVLRHYRHRDFRLLPQAGHETSRRA